MSISLDQFKNESVAQKSVSKYASQGNSWKDGGFLGECVSEINQYCWRVLNVPAGAWGDAKDWATNKNVPVHFDKVASFQSGDILVYGSNYGGGAGHIEIALGGGQALFQNRNGNRLVGTGPSIPNPIAILRKKGVQMATDKLSREEIQVEYRAWTLGLEASEDHIKAWAGRPLSDYLQYMESDPSIKGLREAFKNAMADSAFWKEQSGKRDQGIEDLRNAIRKLSESNNIATVLSPGLYEVK